MQEKVVQTAQDKHGNIIIGDLNQQSNVNISFGGGGNNVVFFAGVSEGLMLRFWGDNGLVFIGDGVKVQGATIDVATNSVCYIDDATTMGVLNLNSAAAKNIIIGRDCMFSHNIEIWNFDGHLIYDSQTKQRIAKAKSIYIGDHIWFGRNAGGFKGFFIASGSIIGTKSMVMGSKIFFSNTANGGYPCRELRENIFWLREGTGDWDSYKEMKFSKHEDDTFIYQFEPDVFLNPSLIEGQLNALPNAVEKLRFLYNVIYCNANKNRFALFRDSNTRASKLYCDYPNAFEALHFGIPLSITYS